MWNSPVPSDSSLSRAIDLAYQEWAPSIQGRPGGERALEEAVLAMPEFGAMETRRARWIQAYSCDEYVRLLETHSDHVLLPPERRSALLRRVGETIREHGNRLVLERETYVLLARRSI
jgi:hypothetical protein